MPKNVCRDALSRYGTRIGTGPAQAYLAVPRAQTRYGTRIGEPLCHLLCAFEKLEVVKKGAKIMWGGTLLKQHFLKARAT